MYECLVDRIDEYRQESERKEHNKFWWRGKPLVKVKNRGWECPSQSLHYNDEVWAYNHEKYKIQVQKEAVVDSRSGTRSTAVSTRPTAMCTRPQ